MHTMRGWVSGPPSSIYGETRVEVPIWEQSPVYDTILDSWPSGVQEQALVSLIEAGELVVIPLPHGFIGIILLRH